MISLTDNEQLALSTFVKLHRAVEAFTERTHRHLADDNLTMSQFGILEAINHHGPLCQRELGKKILKSGGNITTVIDNLVKKQLVIRIQDPADRRYQRVHLTEEGRQLIERALARHAKIMEKEMSVLNRDEQRQLAGLARTLGLGKSH